MSTSQPTPTERARKMYSMLLQRMQGNATSIATALGVSEATISRAKTDHAEQVLLITAHCGLKLVDASKECTNPAELRFLRRVYAIVQEQAPHLLNEEEV